MNMRILLTMSAITLLWCGCGDRVEPVGSREITASASAKDMVVLQSTRTALSGTTFSGETARVLTTTTDNNYSTLHCNGTMTFTNSASGFGYDEEFSGSKWFPEASSTVYVSGLYPATDWDGIDELTIASDNATVTHEIDGKTDLMYASQESTTLDGGPARLEFEHLLTLLKIKFVKSADVAPLITINSIRLVKTARENGYVPLSCDVPLNTGVISFSGETETSSIDCYVVDTDTPFTNQAYALTTTPTERAYILAPPLESDETAGWDYVLEVDYKLVDVVKTDVPVYVNLKADANNYFTGDTAGKAFWITLNFTGEDIEATARMKDWDVLGDSTKEDVETHNN